MLKKPSISGQRRRFTEVSGVFTVHKRGEFPEFSDSIKKGEFLEFLGSIKRGKGKFDTTVVEASLLKRALGYTYEETTREPCVVIRKRGKKPEVREKLVVTKVVTKEVTPDVTVQIFWLKNRQPERWRDRKDIAIGGMVKLILEDEQPEDMKTSEKQKDIKLPLGDENTVSEDE